MSSAIDSSLSHPPGLTSVQQTQVFQGPTPPPEILERYEKLVAGTAKRLFEQAESESMHRRSIELKATEANISAQHKQLEIAEYQSKAVFRSDAIGQTAGLFVSLACIFGAIYLASLGKTPEAIALSAIPTAAVIRAFFTKSPSQK